VVLAQPLADGEALAGEGLALLLQLAALLKVMAWGARVKVRRRGPPQDIERLPKAAFLHPAFDVAADVALPGRPEAGACFGGGTVEGLDLKTKAVRRAVDARPRAPQALGDAGCGTLAVEVGQELYLHVVPQGLLQEVLLVTV